MLISDHTTVRIIVFSVAFGSQKSSLLLAAAAAEKRPTPAFRYLKPVAGVIFSLFAAAECRAM